MRKVLQAQPIGLVLVLIDSELVTQSNVLLILFGNWSCSLFLHVSLLLLNNATARIGMHGRIYFGGIVHVFQNRFDFLTLHGPSRRLTLFATIVCQIDMSDVLRVLRSYGNLFNL